MAILRTQLVYQHATYTHPQNGHIFQNESYWRQPYIQNNKIKKKCVMVAKYLPVGQ